MINNFCRCPYVPCQYHGNCKACMIKSKREGDLPHCMEKIAMDLGAKLPMRKPQTEVYENNYEMSRRCAELVAACLEKKPDSLLCFPAGNSVVETCRIMKEKQEKGEIDFSQAKFVALDEWMDLEDETENCTNFLRKHLYGPMGIAEDHMYLFNTHAEDMEAECKRIDEVIFQHGGIDLVLLGLGMNGHLGLNEPGDSFEDYAKIVTLADTTMNVGQKYFSQPMKLTRGITLGVHHFFDAKQVILQVSGEAKQDIVYEMYVQQPSYELPGTVMKLLDNGLVVLDKAAAKRIKDL